MTAQDWIGIIGALVTLVGAIATGFVLVINAIHTQSAVAAVDRADKHAEVLGAIDRTKTP